MIEKIMIHKKWWENNFPKANIGDVFVFKAIQFFEKQQNREKQKGHTLIKSFEIIEALPLLGIKAKGSLTPYFKRLKNMGLISTVMDDFGNQYYRTLFQEE